MNTFTSSTWLRLLMLSLLTSLMACGGGNGNGNGNSGQPELSIADAQAIDTATSVEVIVTLSKASDQTITVNYATADSTAIAGTDYESTSGTLTFAPDDTTKTVTITLVEGRDTSSIKTFTVVLSDATHATIADNEATVSLLDVEHSALFNNPTYSSSWGEVGVFTNASKCAECHTGTTTVMNFEGRDISPPTQWKHSVMAHSLNDPFFNAMVEEETHVFPHLAGFIEDTCLRCHAPMGYTHAHQNPELLSEEGYYQFETAMNDPHSREGISCTSCHQIQDPTATGEGTAEENLLASMSGHYKINSPDENDVNGASIFGPFTTNTQAMQNQTQYIPEYAAHISESAMCATCHNLYTPTVRLDGTLNTINPTTGEYDASSETVAQFPEQTPYWDWLNSKYPAEGTTCQACHLPEPDPDYQTAVTTKPANAFQRSNFSEHEFVGGNSYLLGLLSKYMEELGIADKTTEEGFNEKISQTQANLQTAADLSIGAMTFAGNTLSIPVTVTNNTGHKLPASFPSRRMWLHIKVTDSSDNIVFESGKYDENGRIVGKDDLFTSSECLSIEKADGFDSLTNQCYEPHHDTITAENQVAIYESVLGDVNQDITHVLLHARQYIKDNRLPPQGWTLANRHQNPADETMYDDNIIGDAVADTNFASGKDAAGSDGSDTVTYSFDVADAGATYTAEVSLMYQSIRPSFAAALHADHEIEEESYVRRFKAMYEDTPPTPETVAVEQSTVN